MYELKNNLASFDDILNVVGSYGWFQKRYYIVFMLFLPFFVSQTYFNYVVVLTSPNHWCKVPRNNLTNYTAQEWMDLTIPKKYNEYGSEVYSSCQMYNISEHMNNSNVVDCQFGWEYDTTWFTETVVSRENWVCKKDFYVANIFAFCRISDVFGCVVASYLGDIYGRKNTFMITYLMLILGRLALVFTSGSFSLFLAASVIGSFGSINMVISATIIAMEISNEKNRSLILMLQTCCWALGLGVMSLIMWGVGDWKYYLLITTLPNLIIFLFIKWMVESPRWLINQGKVSRCMKELAKIAEVNRTKLHEEVATTLTFLSKKKVKNYGILSFFSQWRIAKNTICLNISWGAIGLTYYVLILYFGRFGSNPFITSFFQSVIEIPSNVIGMVSCNYLGRKWTHLFGHLGTTLGCLLLIFIINDTNMEWLSAILTIFLRFTVVLTMYAAYLHTVEIFPTCLRQSGMSLTNSTASTASVLGPYIVYSATKVDSRFPFIILLLLALIGISCVFLLPETLYRPLPETLDEAKKFGCNQKYWSFPTKSKDFRIVKKLIES